PLHLGHRLRDRRAGDGGRGGANARGLEEITTFHREVPPRELGLEARGCCPHRPDSMKPPAPGEEKPPKGRTRRDLDQRRCGRGGDQASTTILGAALPAPASPARTRWAISR